MRCRQRRRRHLRRMARSNDAPGADRPSRRAKALHDLFIRLVAKPGPLRPLDAAVRIYLDAAAPKARGALHVEDLDVTFVPNRHQLQRRQKAGAEIEGMRYEADAHLVGK